jgi:hypothetical protein
VALRYEVLACSPGAGFAHAQVTCEVAAEALCQIGARSAATNLVARRSGNSLSNNPRLATAGAGPIRPWGRASS